MHIWYFYKNEGGGRVQTLSKYVWRHFWTNPQDKKNSEKVTVTTLFFSTNLDEEWDENGEWEWEEEEEEDQGKAEEIVATSKKLTTPPPALSKTAVVNGQTNGSSNKKWTFDKHVLLLDGCVDSISLSTQINVM